MSEARWSDRTRGSAAPAPAPARQTEEHSETASEREARIARLRQLHRQGKYHVDASVLSARIIDEHLKR